MGFGYNLQGLAGLGGGGFKDSGSFLYGKVPRFPSNPLRIRVPFFLILGLNTETPDKKGKRLLLLGNLNLNPKT